MAWLKSLLRKEPVEPVELEDIEAPEESGPMYPVYYQGTFVGHAWKPDQGALWALLTCPAPVGPGGYLFH